MSKLGSSLKAVPPGVFLHILEKPSVKIKEDDISETPVEVEHVAEPQLRLIDMD